VTVSFSEMRLFHAVGQFIDNKHHVSGTHLCQE